MMRPAVYKKYGPMHRARYLHRWHGRPALADLGYDGASIGIHIPVRQPPGGRDLDINTRTRNALLHSLCCLGERGFALLTGRWRTRAALVLTHFGHDCIT
jgi:hypothetical protein